MKGIFRGVGGFGFLAVMVLLCTTSPRVDWQEKGKEELGKEVEQPRQLPVAQYPEVTPPTVQVPAIYPGANAMVVADTVAAPVEQQVNGVEGMVYMSSQCTNDGNYSLTVTFPGRTQLIAQAIAYQGIAVSGPGAPAWPQALVACKVATLDAFALVTFHPGTDPNMAQVLVQNRVSVAEAKLPEEVKPQEKK
jgi:hypothetical protein